MRIDDSAGAGILMCDKATRTQVFGHLLSAKQALPNGHAAQGFINKAANMLGGIVNDRTEDKDAGPGNLTTPGTVTPLPQTPAASSRGSWYRNSSDPNGGEPFPKSQTDRLAKSSLSEVEQADKDRAEIVRRLYKAAANTQNKARQDLLEKLAFGLDRIPSEQLKTVMTSEDWADYRAGDLNATKKAAVRIGQRWELLNPVVGPTKSKRSTWASRHGFA